MPAGSSAGAAEVPPGEITGPAPAAPSDAPPPNPGRGRASLRDFIGSIVILLAIVGVFVGLGRGCSFSPGRPSVDQGAVPTIDASRELRAAASSVDFALRRPELPPDWRANSSSTSAVGQGDDVIVRVGWLTPAGNFVQLSQSGGEPGDVVAAETGRPDGVERGPVEVSGVRWTSYAGRRDEVAWVTRLAGVTTLITGSAGETEFRALAAAVGSAAPLPR